MTDDVKTGKLAIKAACLHELHVHAVINYSVQVFSSNSARFSAIGESHDCKPLFQIQISHRSIDSQAAEIDLESRAEFEVNTCSPKIPKNLLHEIRVGTKPKNSANLEGRGQSANFEA